MKKGFLLLFVAVSLLACGAPPWVNTTPMPSSSESILASPTSLPVSTPTNTRALATVTAKMVNVREDIGGGAVAILQAGDVVEIVACDGSWCQIKEPAGYVWRGCLSDNPAGLACRSK